MAKTVKSKKNTQKDPNNVEIGARLKKFILNNYVTNNNFAETCGMNASQLSEYINGVMAISDNIANKMQEKTGLSKEYLFNGKSPMLLSSSEGAKNKVPSSNDHAASTTARGDLPNSVFDRRRGHKEFLTPQGRIQVVDIALNGIQQGHSVCTQTSDFVEKYKSIFALKLNSYIILDLDYRVDDEVLVSIDEIYYLAIYKGNNMFLDCANGKEIPVTDAKDVIVYGAYYSSIIKGKLK